LPLAEEIMSEAGSCRDLERRAADFVNSEKDVADLATALLGAGYVLAEGFNERSDLRHQVRRIYRKTGCLTSTKIEENSKKNDQFKDFLNYREKLAHVPPHRVLAINRGEKAKVLRVRVEADEEAIATTAIDMLVKPDHIHRDFVIGCVRDALNRLLLPSLEREARRELTEKAEAHAVKVFARNLRHLLLQPPLPGRRVLAIDPGFKAGCKLAALDETGRLLDRAIVHIIGADERKTAARTKIAELVVNHDLNVIAIGNGTACRQSEELVADILTSELAGKEVHYVVVNEAGASVYSTSEIGREELPDCDPMERSAISIGRRLQDPLSELVKIDPASIGVGLYQHDAKARHLRDTLDEVVQSCVSHVGVDLNTASAPLLRYVSGMNQLTARRVYEHRLQHGPFKNRQQLLEVNGLGRATFVQAAGFLKIDGGDNLLDRTWVHPDDYPAATGLLTKLNLASSALADRAAVAEVAARVRELDRQALASEVGLGQFALEQIVSALSRPGRDPREDLPPPIFRRDVVKLDQLEPGMELRGTVLNVVDFGAFVDVGLSDSGLVHISQISNDFIKNPHDRVAVGDQVRVWVASIDKDRRRVALTMIEPGTERPPEPRRSRHERSEQPRRDRQSNVANGDTRPRKEKRRGGRDTQRSRPHGSYEKRAEKELVPITDAMFEGKEAMRSFGDLLQYHRLKKEEKKKNE
jgi:uncharacterized protein